PHTPAPVPSFAAPDHAVAPGPAPASPAPAPPGTASTHAYTDPYPPTAAPLQAPHAVTAPQAAPRTRPGPPRAVAVPVLVVALICFAVGIWALTQT
ncbi:serine/threonine protein kinase, partial [Streptomyces halstedii]|nr:serine/threonine protein kinase [Streptomyces halstedii]